MGGENAESKSQLSTQLSQGFVKKYGSKNKVSKPIQLFQPYHNTMNSNINSSSQVYSLNKYSYNILDFVENNLLENHNGQYYICPSCGGNNLHINPDGNHHCWSDNGCTWHSIKEALYKKVGKKVIANVARKASRKPIERIERPVLTNAPPFTLVAPKPAPTPTYERAKDGTRIKVVKHFYSYTQYIKRVEYLKEDGTRDTSKGHKGKSIWMFHRVRYEDKYGRHDFREIAGAGDRDWGLYRIKEALAADTPYICAFEGEKCADFALSHGISSIAVSAKGFIKADADLERIKQSGKILVLIPDEDSTGVNKILSWCRACTKFGIPYIVVDLKQMWSGILDHNDLVDVFTHFVTEEKTNTEIEELFVMAVNHTILEQIVPEFVADILEEQETEFDPIKEELVKIQTANKDTIPLEQVLPSKLAGMICKQAALLNMRPELFLTVLLTGLSSLHHTETKACLHAHAKFEVSPNIYSCIVAESSNKKTPIINMMAVNPLKGLQKEENARHRQAEIEYPLQLARYEANKKDSTPGQPVKDFPEGKPKEPCLRLYWTDNATNEGIFAHAEAHPTRGQFYVKDEFAGLFKALGQYKGGGGSDEEEFISWYDSQASSRIRAGKVSFVDSLSLSSTGGTQPAVLQKLLGNQKDSNGKWARIMFVNQPTMASRLDPYNEKDIVINDIAHELNWLYRAFDAQSRFAKNYRLSPAALVAFCNAYNEFEQKRQEAADAGSSMAQVYGKSEGRIGKLVITLHVLKHVYTGSSFIPDVVEREEIDNAILLARFYIRQVDGLYTSLDDSADNLAPMLVKILSLAEKNPSGITPSQVAKNFSKQERGIYGADSVKQMFQQLEGMGKGQCVSVGKSPLKFVATTVGSVGQVSVKQPTHLNPYIERVSSNNSSGVGSVGQFLLSSNNNVSSYDTEIIDVSHTLKEKAEENNISREEPTQPTHEVKKPELLDTTRLVGVGQLTDSEPTHEPTVVQLPLIEEEYPKADTLKYEDGDNVSLSDLFSGCYKDALQFTDQGKAIRDEWFKANGRLSDKKEQAPYLCQEPTLLEDRILFRSLVTTTVQ